MATSRQRSLGDALRENPAWRRLFIARSISLLGTWLNTLAIVHLLGRGEVGAALPLAIVFVLKQLPNTVLGPAAGVVADRFSRRRILLACDITSALLVLGFLAFEPGSDHRIGIYALTLLQVSAGTFFDPAFRALVPNLVRDEDLDAANTLGAMSWSSMFAIGTAAGGLILHHFGWRTAIALDACSYLLSVALIATLPATDIPTDAADDSPEDAPSASQQSTWRDIVELFAFVKRHPSLRHIVLSKGTWGVLGSVTLFQTLLGATPAFRVQGSGALGISLLWFCRALGTGLGPPIARRIAPLLAERSSNPGTDASLRSTIGLGLTLALASYAILPSVATPLAAGAVITIAHIGSSTVWVMSTILLQRYVPDRFRGRTFAVELGLYTLASSLSHLLWGTIIDATGVAAIDALRWAVALALGPALLWLWKLRRLPMPERHLH